MRQRLLLGALLLTGCPQEMAATPPLITPPAPVSTRDCVHAFPAMLDFGEIESFTPAFGRVRITNVSGGNALVTATPMASPWQVTPPGPQLMRAGASILFDVVFQPQDGLLHFDQFEVTGPGGCNATVPLRGLGSGALTATPPFMDFGLVAPGQSKTMTVQFTNTRRVPVTVENLVLSSTAGAFDAGPGPYTTDLPPVVQVPALDSLRFQVTATPQSEDFFSASITGTTPFGFLTVPVQLVSGNPIAQLSQTQVDLPLVGFAPGAVPPSFAERVVELRNLAPDGGSGFSILRIEQPVFVQVEALDAGTPGELEVQAAPQLLFGGIAGGASSGVGLRLTPTSPGPKRFRVTLFTNDPHMREQVLTLSGEAVALPACALTIVPLTSLRFTPSAGVGSRGAISFTNAGPERCVVDDLRIDLNADQDYRIADGGFSQLELAPGVTHLVELSGPDAGTGIHFGSIGFHVFNAGSTRQSIDFQAAP